MADPAQTYQTTPQLGNPAPTEAWVPLEAARDLSHSKTGEIIDQMENETLELFEQLAKQAVPAPSETASAA